MKCLEFNFVILVLINFREGLSLVGGEASLRLVILLYADLGHNVSVMNISAFAFLTTLDIQRNPLGSIKIWIKLKYVIKGYFAQCKKKSQ